MNVRNIRRDNSRDKSPFAGLAQHFSANYPIKIRYWYFYSLPPVTYTLKNRRPSPVFRHITIRHIICSRQVVVRQYVQIKHIIMGVQGADRPWGLVKRIANKEMGAGQNLLAGMFRKPRFPADGAVFLGIGFMPHFC